MNTEQNSQIEQTKSDKKVQIHTIQGISKLDFEAGTKQCNGTRIIVNSIEFIFLKDTVDEEFIKSMIKVNYEQFSHSLVPDTYFQVTLLEDTSSIAFFARLL
jgi:hypothetical protein